MRSRWSGRVRRVWVAALLLAMGVGPCGCPPVVVVPGTAAALGMASADVGAPGSVGTRLAQAGACTGWSGSGRYE